MLKACIINGLLLHVGIRFEQQGTYQNLFGILFQQIFFQFNNGTSAIHHILHNDYSSVGYVVAQSQNFYDLSCTLCTAIRCQFDK